MKETSTGKFLRLEEHLILDVLLAFFKRKIRPFNGKSFKCSCFFFSVARRFMAGSQMLRQLYFSALDMELHIRYGAQNNSS